MSSRFKPSFFSTLRLLGVAVVVMSISGCGAPPKKKIETPIDHELETANRMARFAFDKGDFQQAAAAYRRALAQAYVRNDSQAILNARYNLAVCLMTLENYAEALNLVDQALGLAGGGRVDQQWMPLQMKRYQRIFSFCKRRSSTVLIECKTPGKSPKRFWSGPLRFHHPPRPGRIFCEA